ncbi:MAG: hypothetical protein ACXADY_18060 [Candidatus Hodarchaeales archaeon]|jgi:hypothetical protein
MVKLFVKSMLILLIIAISSGLNHSVSSDAVRASPNNANSDGKFLVIDTINIEAEKKNRFLPLEEFISEAPIAEFQENPLPQLLNRTSLRINASYSTIIGRLESLVIHRFSVDVYKVVSGQKDQLNRTSVLSYYYDPDNSRLDLMEFFLRPNSSKSEAIIVPSLELEVYGIYKFVFRIRYHVFGREDTLINSFYHHNITFELVKSYPSPPYIILYAFFSVFFIFLIWVVLGIYGDRKYKQNKGK